MRFFRRLTALLLIVTLPVYAWAALGVTQACPMSAASMAEMADAGHACCDPAVAPADGEHDQPGKAHPCKPGQECKAGSLYHPLFPHIAQPLVAADTVVSTAVAPVLSRDPTAVWRPPRSL